MATEQQTQLQKELVEASSKYADTFTQGDLALPPAKKYLVLTCMDARIDPSAAFGIPLGAAHVVRNAGACAKDALRSIVISQQLLGTKEVFIVKHTGCGMLLFDSETANGLVKERLGEAAVQRVKEEFGGEFLTYTDLEGETKRDVEWLRSTGVVDKEVPISGWIYEVETGKVRRVV